MSSSAEPVGHDPDLDDQPSPELLEELGLGDVESNNLAGHRGHGSPLSVAWVEAIRATGTPAADEATSRYEVLRERIDRLNAPSTPWAGRLALLAELEASGWRAFKSPRRREDGKPLRWDGLRRRWLYRGREWRIPISDEECVRLDELGKNEGPDAWREGVAHLLRAWYERHTTLAGQIVYEPDGVWFLSAWVSCRVWAGDPAYTDWLLRKIVRPAARKLSQDLPPLLGTTQELTTEGGRDHNPREVAIHEGYVHLLDEVIPGLIHDVQRSLVNYWRMAVRNFLLDEIRREERLSSLDAPESPEHELAPVDLLESVDAETSLAELEDRVSAEQGWARLQAQLTPEEQQIVFVKAGVRPRDEGEAAGADLNEAADLGRSNPEVAKQLGISTSTVERRLRRIRSVAKSLNLLP